MNYESQNKERESLPVQQVWQLLDTKKGAHQVRQMQKPILEGTAKAFSKTKPRELHGMSNSPEYGSYLAMKTRCFYPSQPGFKNYGGRGITVCEKWILSFTAFYNDVGPKPNKDMWLDRIDNERGYEPGNVRWATRIEQANNTRANRYIVIDGEKKSVTEWARISGNKRKIITKRIKTGWNPKEAVFHSPLPSGRPIKAIRLKFIPTL